MRFLVFGLLFSALSLSGDVSGGSITPAQMCANLKKELGETFHVARVEKSKVLLNSNSCERSVWWYVNPLCVLEHAGLSLFKLRVDNLGQGNAVFHLLVEASGL